MIDLCKEETAEQSIDTSPEEPYETAHHTHTIAYIDLADQGGHFGFTKDVFMVSSVALSGHGLWKATSRLLLGNLLKQRDVR